MRTNPCSRRPSGREHPAPVELTAMLFWLIVGGAFGLLLLIGAVAQYQKRGNRRFYPHGTDAPNDGSDEPSVVGLPLKHP